MEEVSVEFESRHIEQIDSIQDNLDVSSRSEALRHIIDNHQPHHDKFEDLSNQLVENSEQLGILEKETSKQTKVGKELEDLLDRIYKRGLTIESAKKEVFRPLLGRIAAIYTVGILGTFAFFAREGAYNYFYRYDTTGSFILAVLDDITSPIALISQFLFNILTLIVLLSLVVPIIFVLYTEIPESIDNRLISLLID